MICQLLFMTHPTLEQTLLRTNLAVIIANAYRTLYERGAPPGKLKYRLPDGRILLLMPYSHGSLDFLKTLYIDPKAQPAISGYAVLYDQNTREPLITVDGAVLTGIRTAAKSLTASKAIYQGEPGLITIFGSSTQAHYHLQLFATDYPSANFEVIARTPESAERFRTLNLSRLEEGIRSRTRVVLNDQVSPRSDIVITVTSSRIPLFGSHTFTSNPFIIAVGSSSGDRSEVPTDLVGQSRLFIDSRVSIGGKGEAHLSIQKELVGPDQFTELSDVLSGGASSWNRSQPAVFISKGLAIEDFAILKHLLEEGFEE